MDLQGLQYSTPVAEYIAGNLSIVLDGVAAALTAYGLEFSTTTSVPGQAYGSEIYAHAVRYWLLFPLALVVYAGIVLLATMVQTRQRQVKLWKAFLFPLRYDGLSRSAFANEPVPAEVSGMARLASKERSSWHGVRGRRRRRSTPTPGKSTPLSLIATPGRS